MRKKLLAIASLSAAMYAAPITIYSTGVGAGNVLLAGGSVDTHWTLDSGPLGAGSPIVAGNANPIFAYWAANGGGSQWIAGTKNAMDFVPAGDYVYSTTFDLTGLIASTGTFSGVYYVDNTVVDVKLNGVSLGIAGGDFVNPTTFTINCGSNCNAGLNTLSFVVNNTPTVATPAGLKVTISGTADLAPPPDAPEPSTYAMIASGLGLFSLAKSRRFRK